jgi:hypothetical protein
VALLDERGIRGVDALFVDVEGHELKVLQSFPWSSMRPGLVVYERIHLSPDDAQGCENLLRSLGYALMAHGMDMIGIAGEAPGGQGA